MQRRNTVRLPLQARLAPSPCLIAKGLTGLLSRAWQGLCAQAPAAWLMPPGLDVAFSYESPSDCSAKFSCTNSRQPLIPSPDSTVDGCCQVRCPSNDPGELAVAAAPFLELIPGPHPIQREGLMLQTRHWLDRAIHQATHSLHSLSQLLLGAQSPPQSQCHPTLVITNLGTLR